MKGFQLHLPHPTPPYHPHHSPPHPPFLPPLQAAFGQDPNMKGFQLRVDGKQMEVAARVLQYPRLTYGSPANFDPKVGG